jgi:O-antigen/teichoic acid export membrane protein
MRLIPFFIYRRIAHRPNLLKIVDNIGWLFFDKIIRMGVGLLVGAWLARYLGPEQFGLLSFAGAFIGLFGTIASLGLQEIVVRNIVQNPNTRNETLGTAAFLQLIAGFFAYALILGTIFWLRADDSIAKIIVAILGSTMLFKFSEIALFWFESQVLSKFIVWVQNGCFLLFAVVKAFLIFYGATLIVFAWISLIESVVVAILILVMMTKFELKLKDLTISIAKARELLKDSWPAIFMSMTFMVYTKIDQVMLGQMVGDHAVGIYSAATRISEIWYFIPVVIASSVFPSILEAKKNNNELYIERLQQLYVVMVLMSLAVIVPTALLSKYMIRIIYGNAYDESALILAIHVSGSVFFFLGVVTGKWFSAENRQILNLQRTLVGALVNVAMNYILIPDHGVLGAAAASVVSQFFVVFSLDYFQKETKLMFFMKLKAFSPTLIKNIFMKIKIFSVSSKNDKSLKK